jgi:alcohol dehydrogenase
MLREWYERDAIHQYPFISMLGFGSLSKFKTISDALKFKRALIITGPVLINTEVIKKVKTELDDNKIKYHIFDGTKSNPSIQVVQEIIEMYHKTNADALISVGGGSVHDAAKGAALTLSNNKSLKKLQGINVSKNVSIVPIIAINTTAGTGSGVTNVAVITDESKHFKMTLVDKNIQPHVNVDDSDLMTGLPPKPTT